MEYSHTEAPRPRRGEHSYAKKTKKQSQIPIKDQYLHVASPFAKRMWSALSGTSGDFEFLGLSPSTSGTNLTGNTDENPNIEEEYGTGSGLSGDQ